MEKLDRKKHWESIYDSADPTGLSWYQAVPETSLKFIKYFKLPINAKIIDIGGGDSLLVDHLLELGYEDITILDISATAIAKAKKRLGCQAKNVTWIVTDAASFEPTETYDFWHDRATFHFLTREQEISAYLETAFNHLKSKGILVIGTFSDKGPNKCSGLEVKQYSEDSIVERLKMFFEKIICLSVNHITPAGTKQNFIFCGFRRIH